MATLHAGAWAKADGWRRTQRLPSHAWRAPHLDGVFCTRTHMRCRTPPTLLAQQQPGTPHHLVGRVRPRPCSRVAPYTPAVKPPPRPPRPPRPPPSELVRASEAAPSALGRIVLEWGGGAETSRAAPAQAPHDSSPHQPDPIRALAGLGWGGCGRGRAPQPSSAAALHSKGGRPRVRLHGEGAPLAATSLQAAPARPWMPPGASTL